MDLRTRLMISTIIDIIIIVLMIIFIGLTIYNTNSHRTSPVEKNECRPELVKANDSLKHDNNKLQIEYNYEKEYIENLDNDGTLRKFYELLGK